MDDQPSSFDIIEDWGPWVLDHGLPSLPATLAIDEAVPVARFAGPEYGAVAFVVRWFDEVDACEQLDFDVRPYVRVDGKWLSTGSSGGANWLIADEPVLRRHEWVTSREVAVAHVHASGLDGKACAALIGLAGNAAASVRVTTAGGEVTRPIDSPLGVIVAAADASVPAEVAVLAEDGSLLATEMMDESSPPAQ